MKIEEVKITDELVAKIGSGEIPIQLPPKLMTEWEITADTKPADIAEKVKTMDIEAYAPVLRGKRIIVVTRAYFDRMGLQSRNPAAHLTETGVKSIWEFEAQILEVYPELSGTFKDSKALIESGHCTGCSARRETNRVLSELAALAHQYPERTIPPRILNALGPQFSRHLERMAYDYKFESLAKTGNVRGKYFVQPIPQHAHAVGVRPTCTDCIRKHLGQAVILFQESESAEYSNHFWLAIGHLAEAESEALSSFPTFAKDLREIRLAMMADRDFVPNISSLFDDIDMLEVQKEKMDAAQPKKDTPEDTTEDTSGN